MWFKFIEFPENIILKKNLSAYLNQVFLLKLKIMIQGQDF